MKAHPYAELFPMFQAADLAALARDIQKEGLKEKITTFPFQDEPSILDGRNREAACFIAEVEPQYEPYQGSDPLGYVLSRNLHRRHLSTDERSEIAAKLSTLREASDDALTEEAAAEMLGVSRSSVQRAKRKKKEPQKTDWSDAELKEDTDLRQALTKIGVVHGKSVEVAVQVGTVGLNRKEVLYWADLTNEQMDSIEDFVMGKNWKPSEAIDFLEKMADENSTVEDLQNWALANPAKVFTADIGGFEVTCRLKKKS